MLDGLGQRLVLAAQHVANFAVGRHGDLAAGQDRQHGVIGHFVSHSESRSEAFVVRVIERVRIQNQLTEQVAAGEVRIVDDGGEAAGNFANDGAVFVPQSDVESQFLRHSEIVLKPSACVGAAHSEWREATTGGTESRHRKGPGVDRSIAG